MVCTRILGIQLQRAPKLGLGSRPIPPMAHGEAEGGTRLTRLGIDLDGFACRRVSFRERLSGSFEPVPRQPAIAVGQPGIGRGIGWIVVDRLLKKSLRFLHALAGSLIPVVAALQVRL